MEETCLVPGAVVVTSPLRGSILPLVLVLFPAERPQAASTATADTAAAATPARRLRTIGAPSSVRIVDEASTDPGLLDLDGADVLGRDVGEVGVDDREVGI